MSAPRLTYCSVTNFLRYGDEYLFVLRGPQRKVDPNRLNGIGGKLEHGENYLDAAIRETHEETGYVVDKQQVTFAGVGRLEGGYAEDWVMSFFMIDVPTKEIPLGSDTPEGQLLWMTADAALHSVHELVDDLKIVLPKIVSKEPFFFSSIVNTKEKMESYTISSLPAA